MGENPSEQSEIQSSLDSLVQSSEKWLGRLTKRESRVRLASSSLAAILVFATICWGLVFLLSRGQIESILQDMNRLEPILGVAALAGAASGFATYVSLRRRHDAALKELSSIIEKMKVAKSKEDEGITEDALSLTDKLFTLLPELARRRIQDPFLFGVLAFAIALFAGNLAIAILIGVIVWLYFRYETRKKYEEETLKFVEQKRAFEQRKRDFIESL
jgi:hypothetical protein